MLQCVFTSETERCEFCQERNITTCVKIWGPHKEGRISRLVPTAIDAVIEAEDVLLLQLAYSDSFYYKGTVIGQLLKRFAVIFGPSINDASLRQAMLAFTAASAGNYERSMIHWNTGSAGLMTKARVGFSEPDLFAAGLLAVVDCLHRNADNFTLDIRRFITIMNSLVDQNKNRRSLSLAIFWPDTRDFILEGSRYFPHETPLLLSFSESCRRGMGSQSIRLRTDSAKELFGVEATEYGFCASMWKYMHLLWRCFRLTAGRQVAGDSRRDKHISATVAEVKDDLLSVESLGSVDKFMALKVTQRLHQRDNPQYNRSIVCLLMYRFCQLLIILLERETIVEAALSADAISAATVALLLVPSKSELESAVRSVLDFYLPRVLSVAGLVFPKTTHPERISLVISPLITLVAKSVVDQLQMYEYWDIARGLEEFWESGDIKHALEILSKEDRMIMIMLRPSQAAILNPISYPIS
jgi:hypothetical protein